MPRTITNVANRIVTLDARADRFDLRDRPYTPRIANLPPEFPSRERVKVHLPGYLKPGARRVLDQGREGACTGFGLAAVINYRIDKRSVIDMQAALVEIGAIYVSGDVHDGWSLPVTKASFTDYTSLPVIPFGSASKISGGHAFALVGYTATGFVVQNSWGRDWGMWGFAILTYADWITNGTDAWTVSLGVPIVPPKAAGLLRSPRAFSMISGGLSASLSGAGGALPPAPTEKPYWQPLDEPGARERMVVMGNNGMSINRLVECANAEQAVAQVGRHQALVYFAQHPAGKRGNVKRVALYAHGGLNSEAESAVRTGILAPYFQENGIYPIFIAWKSGAGQIIRNILQDRSKEIGVDSPFAAGVIDKIKHAGVDTWNRAIKVRAQNLGAKSIWSEMKQNAIRGIEPGNALALIADELAALRKEIEKQGQRFELHLIGHSAGSIVLGHMLDLFSDGATRKVLASCSLYAPACTVAFANAHYVPAVKRARILDGTNFHIAVLSDDRETGDSVGPYRKSLLYLVSRALEDLHKMPILGLLKAFDPACNHDEHWNEPQFARIKPDIKQWQDFWWGGDVPNNFYLTGRGLPNANLVVVDRAQVNSGARRIRAAHGTFDNDIGIVQATLGRLIGSGREIAPTGKNWNLDY